MLEGGIDPEVILKTVIFEQDYLDDIYEFTRMDVLVMERLTTSPRIADIYGHCAMSVLTENLPGLVEDYVVPQTSSMPEGVLHDEDDVQPLNNFTATEKLEMALAMAEGIADLHGFKDGVIGKKLCVKTFPDAT